MSEFFEIAQRERELYAVLRAARNKRNEAGVEMASVISTYGPAPSTAETKARDQLLEIIREENAARSAWAKVYEARKALEVSAKEVAA